MGGGLQRICKMYGQMSVVDKGGNETVWYWDYHNDEAVPQGEWNPTRRHLSDRAKARLMKQQFDKMKDGDF